MPIYNSLITQSRTQIDFKGNTRVDFATYVYPKLKNQRGVVTTGLDELVINEKPKFTVYLDANKSAITADVLANYGNFRLNLPSDTPMSEKIVIRDMARENDVIKHFSHFSLYQNEFYTTDEDVIFEFITE